MGKEIYLNNSAPSPRVRARFCLLVHRHCTTWYYCSALAPLLCNCAALVSTSACRQPKK